MSWATVVCAVVRCDVCGYKCWGSDQDRPPLFTSLDEARRTLVADWEWEITGELMLCADCSATRACERNGHLWRDDQDAAELLAAFDAGVAGAATRRVPGAAS